MSLVECPLLSREQNPNQKNMDESENSTTVSLHEKSCDSYTTHSTYDEDALDEFTDMDEECIMGQATVMDTTKDSKRASVVEAPTVPQRSSLRASKIFDKLRLTSIESATQSLASTHEMYLSSEEDASSSADDFSDYESDTATDESPESPVRRRRSHEDTAKIVSVVFSGKPCIVELPRRAISPVSVETRPQTSGAESQRPPRQPMRQSSLFTTTTLPTQRPSFLNTDPYATGNYCMDSPKDDEVASPRTPRNMAVFRGVSRTLSLVRKRSRHTLNQFNKNGAGDSPTLTSSSSTLDLLQTVTAPEAPPKEEEKLAEIVTSPTVMSPQSPVSYNDIIKAATRAAKRNTTCATTPSQPISPMSPISPATPKKGLLKGLNMNRRRSMKA
ncbi:uncharacterized protein BCR38DRAFT_22373 [Pseudomassariella vexata]|uniref:Uncharacterized protein n=1 Tax=Pseudomassariella vexata TaxID=1141098 RepID=A0A1Y2EK31_9PEZI|nr:uncharacterized protein BCR38DRAFT_22373 [Pseudomassariella vexata]ORY71877.1 hypothetical protein BCR38DRAFT_22373 [Pseudomassariella vexata]